MKKLFLKTLIFVFIAWAPGLVAAESIADYLDSPFYGHSNEKHHFQFLKTGPLALQGRLELIRSAQESIEFEYFVFKVDKSGRLLLQELAKKAREGVDVKILFDHFGSFTSVSKYLVRELVKSGVEFRAYNQGLTNVYLAQHRNHRKLIVVDGETVLSGGRNSSEKYFGLSEDYNLADRDYILEGPIVSKMRESFYAYWNSDIVGPRDYPTNIRRRHFIRRFRERKAKNVLSESSSDRRLKQELKEFVSNDIKNLPKSSCSDVLFVTDVPGVGADARGDEFRLTREVVYGELNNVSHKAYIESPYIVFDDVKDEIVENLINRGVEVSFKTNSLRATNVMPVTSAFYHQITEKLEMGASAYLFKGEELSHHDSFPGSEKAEWGIHSKTMIFDNDKVMLGSFNFDPRSTIWNSEYALFCQNKSLAETIKGSINSRLNYSYLLTTPEDLNEYGFKNTSFLKRFMHYNFRYPADWFSFLL